MPDTKQYKVKGDGTYIPNPGSLPVNVRDGEVISLTKDQFESNAGKFDLINPQPGAGNPTDTVAQHRARDGQYGENETAEQKRVREQHERDGTSPTNETAEQRRQRDARGTAETVEQRRAREAATGQTGGETDQARRDREARGGNDPARSFNETADQKRQREARESGVNPAETAEQKRAREARGASTSSGSTKAAQPAGETTEQRVAREKAERDARNRAGA